MNTAVRKVTVQILDDDPTNASPKHSDRYDGYRTAPKRAAQDGLGEN